MCNVPELVMCYHLEGIVQKYELIKTEDVPHLENSKFSPKVIRDVAQNILSFLKANATKAGHTYWLFKGKYRSTETGVDNMLPAVDEISFNVHFKRMIKYLLSFFNRINVAYFIS